MIRNRALAWTAVAPLLFLVSCGADAPGDEDDVDATANAWKHSCGDGICQHKESCSTCPQDCGACTSATSTTSTTSTTSGAGGSSTSSGAGASSTSSGTGGGATTTCPLPAYPDASCTGVPAGTMLTPYAGPSTISTPNTVIDKKTMGCIQVTAPGVVIKNSKISCPGGGVYVDDKSFTDAATPLVIEDSEIDCQDVGGTAVGEADITLRRVNIHGCENGFDINQNMTIEDSYIHDLFNSEEAHTDGIQLSFGHWDGSSYPCCARNVTIRHNTIYGMGADASFGTSAIISNSGGDVNILIENNLLAGGAYTLYCEQGTQGTNYKVLNNHFSTAFGPNVGYYGPATDCGDETQSGNVIHETLQPLTLE